MVIVKQFIHYGFFDGFDNYCTFTYMLDGFPKWTNGPETEEEEEEDIKTTDEEGPPSY